MRPSKFHAAVLFTVALIASALAGIIGAAPAEACDHTCGEAWIGLGYHTEVRPNPPYGQLVSFDVAMFDRSDSCFYSFICDYPTGSVALYQDGVGPPFAVLPLHQDTSVDDFSSATDTFSTSAIRGGNALIFAVYQPGGENPFTPTQTEEHVPLVEAPTATSLSQSSTSSAAGQPVTLTAHVAPTVPIDTAHGAHMPTAFVDFAENGVSLGGAQVDNSGNAVFTVPLSGGTHQLKATYMGDGDFAPSTSNPLWHSVTKGNSHSDLLQSTATTVFGEPITLTDEVTAVPPAAGTPTGVVTFKDAGNAIARQNLSGGSAAVTGSGLGVGSHSLTADYGGDANFEPSVASVTPHTVNKANTQVSLTSPTSNPSTLGQPVALNATVSVVAPGAGAPTGSVQFRDGATPLGAAVPLSGTTASYTTSSLGGGNHTITATYLGDTNFNSSTSSPLSRTVTCDRIVTGSVNGNYDVPATGTTCISNANITGGVNVPPGARLSMVGSTLGNYLTANSGAGTLVICGTTLPGITINGAAGAVTLGDPWNGGCAGNTLSGGIGLASNHAGVRVNGNRIGSGLQVTGTTGGPTIVGGNTIAGWLQCSGNSPTAANGGHPNTAGGRTGECAATGF